MVLQSLVKKVTGAELRGYLYLKMMLYCLIYQREISEEFNR